MTDGLLLLLAVGVAWLALAIALDWRGRGR